MCTDCLADLSSAQDAEFTFIGLVSLNSFLLFLRPVWLWLLFIIYEPFRFICVFLWYLFSLCFAIPCFFSSSFLICGEVHIIMILSHRFHSVLQFLQCCSIFSNKITGYNSLRGMSCVIFCTLHKSATQGDLSPRNKQSPVLHNMHW